MKSKVQHLTKANVQLINEEYGSLVTLKGDNVLFYVFDSSFNVPKCYINILLRYKNPYSFAKHVRTIEEMFVKIYDDLLNAYQVTVEVNVCHYGVNIKIGGFSVYIKKITEIFMNFYFKNSDNSREEIIKEQIMDDILSSIYLSPYRRTFQGLYKSLIEDYLYPEEKLAQFESDMFIFDISEYKASIDIVGNISLIDSKFILELVTSYSKNKSNYNKKISQKYNKIVELQSTDTENNAVGFFYKICSPKELESNAKGRIILQLLQERFFNQLRTIEELGYIVTSNLIILPNTKLFNQEVIEIYLYFVVQSEKDTDFLIDRIKKFIGESKEYIAILDKSTFELYQESVVDSLKEKPKNLYDYSEFINELFTFGITDLTFKEKLIEKVRNVSKDDIKSFDIFSQDPLIVVVKKA